MTSPLRPEDYLRTAATILASYAKVFDASTTFDLAKDGVLPTLAPGWADGAARVDQWARPSPDYAS